MLSEPLLGLVSQYASGNAGSVLTASWLTQRWPQLESLDLRAKSEQVQQTSQQADHREACRCCNAYIVERASKPGSLDETADCVESSRSLHQN